MGGIETTSCSKAVSKGSVEEKSMSPNKSNEHVEKSHPSWMGIPALGSTEKITALSLTGLMATLPQFNFWSMQDQM